MPMNQSSFLNPGALTPLPESVTSCATIDEAGREQIITELMIRRACEQMDKDQLWPVSKRAVCRTIRPLSATESKVIPFRRAASLDYS